MNSAPRSGRANPDLVRSWQPVVLVIVVFIGTPLIANGTPMKGADVSAETEDPDPLQSGAGFMPYCGLYSLHTAMKSLNKSLPFVELLKPVYISNRFGSTMADLIRAAKDHDMYVEPMNRMTSVMLRQASCPVILHVKPQLSATKYNHWVLFMGMAGNKARIYDGKTMALEPIGRLSARWDGTGLFVSDRPIDRNSIMMAAGQQFLLFMIVVVAAVLILRDLRSRWPIAGSWSGLLFHSAGQAACIMAVALTAGWGYRTLGEAGYLSEPEAVEGIQNFYKAKLLPVLKMPEIVRMLGRTNLTIVDARWSPDYEAGHLPGAINITPSANEVVVEKAMHLVPRDQLVIVYCQSPGCPYSEGIAKRLMEAGYSNLALYRGGWVEWKASKNPQATKTAKLYPSRGHDLSQKNGSEPDSASRSKANVNL